MYSVAYCSLAPSGTVALGFTLQRLGELFLIALAFTTQTVYPIAIIVNFFNNGVDTCPRRAEPFLRFLALKLSLLFAAVSFLVCHGKLRGLLFLFRFCPIDGRRSLVFLGIVGQLIGITTASVAEFLLFVSIDPEATKRLYLTILFVSLTMQFTLHLDARLVSSSQSNSVGEVIDAIGADELILGGSGTVVKKAVDEKDDSAGSVGEDEHVSVLPKATAAAVEEFRSMGNIVAGTIVLALGGALSIAVAICI